MYMIKMVLTEDYSWNTAIHSLSFLNQFKNNWNDYMASVFIHIFTRFSFTTWFPMYQHFVLGRNHLVSVFHCCPPPVHTSHILPCNLRSLIDFQSSFWRSKQPAVWQRTNPVQKTAEFWRPLSLIYTTSQYMRICTHKSVCWGLYGLIVVFLPVSDPAFDGIQLNIIQWPLAIKTLNDIRK